MKHNTVIFVPVLLLSFVLQLDAQSRYPEYPAKVLSVKGGITQHEAILLRSDGLNSLHNLQFSTTADVLVISDRYQRSFYVTPAHYTTAETGISCTDSRADCTPVVKDHLGNVIQVLTTNEWTYGREDSGKSEALEPVSYATERTVYPTTQNRYQETSTVKSGKATPYKVLIWRE
jgi:hypothetical protein